MVLERAVPITVWGWATSGERVWVKFRQVLCSTRTAADGRWSVILPPSTAGGPDHLTFRGRNALTVRNVLVGEVWVASGQSNKEFPVARQGGFDGVAAAERELASANVPAIRLLTVRRDTALVAGADIVTEGWKVATPTSVGRFSAVGYLVARDLYESLGVPIGIIQSARGGPGGITGERAGTRQIPGVCRRDRTRVAGRCGGGRHLRPLPHRARCMGTTTAGASMV